MITSLSIQGLAIIDQLQIDFTRGFNVITGETGAGKSILIRALGFLTGGKASSDVIRSGWQAATVAGEFQVSAEHPCQEVLRALGIELGEGSPLLLRRQVQLNGRSQAWINDVPVALPSLKQVGQTLLDVFAQHENQKLLNLSDQVQYVDSFISNKALLLQVQSLGRRSADLIRELQGILEAGAERQRQCDYWRFRFDELKAFGPSEEDFQRVQNICRDAEGLRKHREPLARALSVLDNSESGASAPVREAAKLLAGLADAQGLRERLTQCVAEIEDVGYELGRILSRLEFDESELEQSQERLFGYQELFRKHSVRDIENLMQQYQSLETQLEQLGNIEERLCEKLTALEDTASEWTKQCERLSIARHQAAQGIKVDVERELAELHMPGSVFQAEFTAVRRSLPDLDWTAAVALAARWEKLRAVLSTKSEHGAESARFFLSANPGEPPQPLARVASGGELSRIMLALKKALVADAETCVLVFDEIDAGISGRVADVMGRKMRELAKDFQVICISHLPQVAVYADAHFLVTKKGKGDRTQSSIIPLSSDQSAEEIARLLSGKEVSDTSLKHAKTLIASAKKQNRSISRVQPTS